MFHLGTTHGQWQRPTHPSFPKGLEGLSAYLKTERKKRQQSPHPIFQSVRETPPTTKSGWKTKDHTQNTKTYWQVGTNPFDGGGAKEQVTSPLRGVAGGGHFHKATEPLAYNIFWLDHLERENWKLKSGIELFLLINKGLDSTPIFLGTWWVNFSLFLYSNCHVFSPSVESTCHIAFKHFGLVWFSLPYFDHTPKVIRWGKWNEVLFTHLPFSF